MPKKTPSLPTVRSARLRPGFTFIELMLVIVILGVVMAVAIPQMGGRAQSTALDSTGRNIARLAEYARQSAIISGQEARLTIDREAGAWWLDLSPDAEERDLRETTRRSSRGTRRGTVRSDEEITQRLPERLSIREVVRDGRAVRDNRTVISFYPAGSSTGGAIVIENQHGETLTIEIERATGRAMAYVGEPKTFAQRLEEAGLDPTRYGERPTQSAQAASERGTGFSRTAGSEEERVRHYQNAAERIFSRVEERQSAQREAGRLGGL